MTDSSPFDEALARPFLDEPVKKRWSLLTALTSSTTASSQSSDDEKFSVDYREYEAPEVTLPVEEVVFESKEDEDEEEGAFVLASALEEGRALPFERALLEERHRDIADINREMRQINEIQKELALTVTHQDHDVNQITSMAIESAQRASEGFTHVVFVQQRLAAQSRRKRRAMATVATSLFLLVALHWVVTSLSEEHSEGGSPQWWKVIFVAGRL